MRSSLRRLPLVLALLAAAAIFAALQVAPSRAEAPDAQRGAVQGAQVTEGGGTLVLPPSVRADVRGNVAMLSNGESWRCECIVGDRCHDTCSARLEPPVLTCSGECGGRRRADKICLKSGELYGCAWSEHSSSESPAPTRTSPGSQPAVDRWKTQIPTGADAVPTPTKSDPTDSVEPGKSPALEK